MRNPAKSVDDYITAAPKQAQSKLVQLRKIVKAAAPEADEAISYNMPYYKYHGALVGFAAFKDHIGLFGALTDEEREEFKDYQMSKGTISFPVDKPLPAASITKLVKARRQRNEMKDGSRKY